MLDKDDSQTQDPVTSAPRTLQFAEETFDEFWPDAGPLLDRNYREVAAHQDVPLAVDVDAYRNTEAAGRLCILTARDAGHLVGYAVFVVSAHPHYKSSFQAQQDVLYLDAPYRRHGFGVDILRFSERVLGAKGCQFVIHHAKVAHPALGELLAHRGYDVVEHIYVKRLSKVWG
jgi:GNAT superfamily N-acetyltransferase